LTALVSAVMAAACGNSPETLAPPQEFEAVGGGVTGVSRSPADLVYELKNAGSRRSSCDPKEIIAELTAAGPAAVPELIAALRTRTLYGRRMTCSSAEVLGQIGDPRAVGPLIGLLDYDAVDVPKTAAEGLVKIGEPAVLPLIAALGQLRSTGRAKAAEALGEIGDLRAVAPLIAELKDSHSVVRADAARALGKLGDRRAVLPLIAMSRDHQDWVRFTSARAVAALGHRRGVELLIALLESNHWETRGWAASALGNVGDARAVEPLIAALDDTAEFSDVAEKAARALGELGDPRAVEPLIDVLESDRWQIYVDAAWALGAIGDARAVKPLIERLANPFPHIGGSDDAPGFGGGAVGGGMIAPDRTVPTLVEALVKIGEPAVDPLIDALEDEDYRAPGSAARALGMIGDRRAVGPLIAALDVDSSNVAATAAAALAKMPDPRAIGPLLEVVKKQDKGVWHVQVSPALKEIGAAAVEPLIEALSDESPQVRLTAARALLDIGDRRAEQSLIEACRDRHFALRTIGAHDRVEAFDTLSRDVLPAVYVAALDDEDAWYRVISAHRLAQRGDPRGWNGLVAVLKDENNAFRQRAAYALAEWDDPRAFDVIQAAIHGNDEFPPGIALPLLAASGGPRATALLIDALDNPGLAAYAESALVKIGPAAVEPLLVALTDKQSSACHRVAKILGELDDPRAVPGLVVALDDQRRWVSAFAARALGKIGGPLAVDALVARITKEACFNALVTIGPPATEALVRAVETAEPDVRRKAAFALGSIGDRRAAAALIAILQDEYNSTAARWLGRLGDPRAVEFLTAELHGDDPNLARSAATALADIGPPVVAPLVTALQGEKRWTRCWAAEALAKIRDRRTVQPLIAALGDADRQVRCYAAQALGRIEDARAVEPLLKVLKDEDSGVRLMAARALGKLEDVRAVEPLLALLWNEKENRYGLETALRRIGGPRAAQALEALRKQEDR